MRRIAVIGGGASGMAAAIQAAHTGRALGVPLEITLLEKLPRVGKKLLATGNGRCNLTNSRIEPGRYTTGDPVLLGAVLDGLDARAILDFFGGLGLRCAEREAGRVYPMSNQASSVLDVLLGELARLGIRVECDFAVRSLRRAKGGWTLTDASGRQLGADRVILSAGGSAAPAFGTDGGGFALARALGHSVTALYPALVPLKTAGELAKGLKGIRAVCTATLCRDGRAAARESGEVQFTEYGLSGIPIMQLSNRMEPADGWSVELDFFEADTAQSIAREIAQRAASRPDEQLETLLAGTVHKRVGFAAMKQAGLAPLSRANGSLCAQEIDRLAETLKRLRFAVTGTVGWAQAQTTGGGVPLGEIDPQTMESRRAPGVYLCGELLDAAGSCGGFNLHWAWATGLRAGAAAARRDTR